MDMVIDSVMIAKDEDRSRFLVIIQKAIDTKEISPKFPLDMMNEDEAEDDICDESDEEKGGGKLKKGQRMKKSKKSNITKTNSNDDSVSKDKQAKLKKAQKRKEAAAIEALEAEELLKEIQLKNKQRGSGGGGGGGGLAEMIQARNSERSGNFDSWAAGLEARYKDMEQKKKQKRSSKK